MKKTLYLAYGSNLNVGQMAHRCPGARPVESLLLEGYRLVFRNVADVIEDPGGTVPCGVWELTPPDVAALDRYEGVAGGLYRREWLHLLDIDSPCLVYQMNRTGFSPPAIHYLEIIREGYRDFGLPEEYLNRAVEEAREADRPLAGRR